MKNEILSVSTAYDTGCQTWMVGKEGVVKIIDLSREYPDHTEFIFDIIGDNEKMIARLIGGHIIVYYQ